MKYRAVKNRCAVDFSSLRLPISNEEALNVLTRIGFSVVNVDIIAIARECVGESRFFRGAKPSDAPGIVDCSSFVKWLYGMWGIWLPRWSIQQCEFGRKVDLKNVFVGDLVFASGYFNFHYDDPLDGIGHVGIATGDGTVICAANWKGKYGIVECSFDEFVEGRHFRGVRRYIPKRRNVLTLDTPPEREIETSDDIRWIVLQSLPLSSMKGK